jgi:hypothetical protein
MEISKEEFYVIFTVHLSYKLQSLTTKRVDESENKRCIRWLKRVDESENKRCIRWLKRVDESERIKGAFVG